MNELASELLTLLDLIENETTSANIRALTKQRFEICEKYGLKAVFGEQTSGEIN